MSDWQVGDLAVCVDDRDNPYIGPSLVSKGIVYAVVGLSIGLNPFTLRAGVGLRLSGMGNERFASSRFRKIRPDEQEACEPEFVTLLKRIKRTAPHKEPASEWLIRVGPLAKRLNEQSKHDPREAGEPNKQPASNR